MRQPGLWVSLFEPSREADAFLDRPGVIPHPRLHRRRHPEGVVCHVAPSEGLCSRGDSTRSISSARQSMPSRPRAVSLASIATISKALDPSGRGISTSGLSASVTAAYLYRCHARLYGFPDVPTCPFRGAWVDPRPTPSWRPRSSTCPRRPSPISPSADRVRAPGLGRHDAPRSDDPAGPRPSHEPGPVPPIATRYRPATRSIFCVTLLTSVKVKRLKRTARFASYRG